MPNPISREFGGFDPAGLNDEGEWYDNPSWEAGYTMSTDEIRQHNVNTLKDRFNAQKQGGYNFSYDDEIDNVRNISASNGGWSLPQSVMKTPEGFDALRSAKDEVISWIKDQQRAEKATYPDPSWESKANEEALGDPSDHDNVEKQAFLKKLKNTPNMEGAKWLFGLEESKANEETYEEIADGYGGRRYIGTSGNAHRGGHPANYSESKEWLDSSYQDELLYSKYYKELQTAQNMIRDGNTNPDGSGQPIFKQHISDYLWNTLGLDGVPSGKLKEIINNLYKLEGKVAESWKSVEAIAKEAISEDEKDDIFQYLFDLQESGITNMFGAGPYVEREFPHLDKKEVRDVVLEWMKNYETIHARMGIESKASEGHELDDQSSDFQYHKADSSDLLRTDQPERNPDGSISDPHWSDRNDYSKMKIQDRVGRADYREAIASEDYGNMNIVQNPDLDTDGYPMDQEGFARANWDDASIEDRKNWLFKAGYDSERGDEYEPYFSLDSHIRAQLAKDLQIGGIYAMGTGSL